MSDIFTSKQNILIMLEDYIDQYMSSLSFKRRKGSLNYKRLTPGCITELKFFASYNPKYERNAAVHIQPTLIWKIPTISECALSLLDGNKLLLANTPDLIVKQHIELFAPSEIHERWFLSSPEECSEIAARIVRFIDNWLTDYIALMTDPNSLIAFYENPEFKILRQQHWYMYVVAAYFDLDMKDKAREVLHKHLGNPTLRKRYASAYVHLEQ